VAQAHDGYIVIKIVKETSGVFQKVATGYIVIIIVKEPRDFIQKVATGYFGVFFIKVISMYPPLQENPRLKFTPDRLKSQLQSFTDWISDEKNQPVSGDEILSVGGWLQKKNPTQGESQWLRENYYPSPKTSSQCRKNLMR